MKPTAAEWVSKAEGDFAIVERECRARKNPSYDGACFHAQQCAEKYLKALLLFAGGEPPKTHDLRLLLQRLPAAMRSAFSMEHMVELNRYSVEARYPGEWDPISRAEAERAVVLARATRNTARALLAVQP